MIVKETQNIILIIGQEKVEVGQEEVEVGQE